MKNLYLFLFVLLLFGSCKKDTTDSTSFPAINLEGTKFTAEWYKLPSSAFYHYLVLNFINGNQVEYYEYFGIDDGKNQKIVLSYTVQNPNDEHPKLKIVGKADKKIGEVQLDETINWEYDIPRNLQTKQTAYLEIGAYMYRR